MTNDACQWREDVDPWGDEQTTWATACGHRFTFNDGTPTENQQTFCGYCGRRLVELRSPPPVDEDEA